MLTCSNNKLNNKIKSVTRFSVTLDISNTVRELFLLLNVRQFYDDMSCSIENILILSHKLKIKFPCKWKKC